MKHLIAMLFYNIVIGSTVMFKDDYEKVLKENFRESLLSPNIWKNKKYKVIGIYSTFFVFRKSKKLNNWRARNFFQIMVCIESITGDIDYMGISTLKELTI